MLFRRLLGAVVIGLLLLVAPPTVAHAEDDYLVGSDPQPRQELNGTPGYVTLAFQTKADAKLAKILVLDSSGKNVTMGALIVEGTNVTTQLQFELPRGTYSVYYRTSSANGEPRGGAFQFAYGKGEWTPLDREVWVGEEEQPPIMSNPDPNSTQSGTPAPTQSASPAPSDTASASPTSPGATPAGPTSPGQQPTSGGGATGWLIAAAVVVAGLLGWAVVLFVRNRRAG